MGLCEEGREKRCGKSWASLEVYGKSPNPKKWSRCHSLPFWEEKIASKFLHPWSFFVFLFFFSSLMSLNWWIHRYLERPLYGEKVRMDAPNCAWIAFWFLVIGRPIFPEVSQLLLPRPMSNHSPILLNCGGGLVRAWHRSDLKTCGWKRRGLVSLSRLGGKARNLGATLALCLRRSCKLWKATWKNAIERYLATCQFTKSIGENKILGQQRKERPLVWRGQVSSFYSKRWI